VNGGNFPTTTWVTRDLNTINSFGPAPANVTIAANQMTFRAGVYKLSARAPVTNSQVQSHQRRVFNITGAAILAMGTSALNNANVSTVSEVSTFLNFAGNAVVELQHFRTGAGPARMASESPLPRRRACTSCTPS